MCDLMFYATIKEGIVVKAHTHVDVDVFFDRLRLHDKIPVYGLR
jgi:hypothetical protein